MNQKQFEEFERQMRIIDRNIKWATVFMCIAIVNVCGIIIIKLFF